MHANFHHPSYFLWEIMVPVRASNFLVGSSGVFGKNTHVDHVMATQFIVSLRERSIGAQVADLSSRSDEIVSAMDMLFHGF